MKALAFAPKRMFLGLFPRVSSLLDDEDTTTRASPVIFTWHYKSSSSLSCSKPSSSKSSSKSSSSNSPSSWLNGIPSFVTLLKVVVSTAQRPTFFAHEELLYGDYLSSTSPTHNLLFTLGHLSHCSSRGSRCLSLHHALLLFVLRLCKSDKWQGRGLKMGRDGLPVLIVFQHKPNHQRPRFHHCLLFGVG